MQTDLVATSWDMDIASASDIDENLAFAQDDTSHRVDETERKDVKQRRYGGQVALRSNKNRIPQNAELA